MALASIDDYKALTGQTVATSDEARVEYLLDIASDVVLASAYGQQITAGQTDDLEVIPHDGLLYLPQRPVVAVLSMTDGNGDPIDLGDVRVEPGGYGKPATISLREGYFATPPTETAFFTTSSAFYTPGPVTVSYTHGWDPIPGSIIAAVVSLAANAFGSGVDAGVVSTQESTGPFQNGVTYADPIGAGMRLPDGMAATLWRLCGVRRPASLPILRDRL